MKSELLNQPTGIPSEDVLKEAGNRNDLIRENILAAFGISEAELIAMTNGEHFNHQY